RLRSGGGQSGGPSADLGDACLRSGRAPSRPADRLRDRAGRARAPPARRADQIVMRILGAAVAIGGVPVAALVLLTALGWAPVGPALLAIAATVLAALLLGRCLVGDLDLLRERVRRIAAGEPTPTRAAALPAMQRLDNDLERLA